MKTRCPCCGATLSLDALLAHDDAREALKSVLNLSGELGRALVRYLGLFRPAERDLTMQRMAKLINELLPDITSQRITRNRQVFDAPLDAWVFAFNQAVCARDNGSLTTPLRSHGWLYEVISRYKPEQTVLVKTSPQSVSVSSKTMAGIKTLEERINGRKLA